MDKPEDTKALEIKVQDAFLTEEEKTKLRREALAEVDAENKKRIAAEYKAAIKADAKKKLLFKDAASGANEQGLVPVFIELPAVSDCIRIDGTAFYPGRKYNVTPELREVLLEVMGRGESHEDEVSGRKDSNLGRKKRSSVARLNS